MVASCCTKSSPPRSDFAVLINPTSPALAKAQTNDLQAAARALGLQLSSSASQYR